MSLALRDERSLLDWRLIPATCKEGALGCGQNSDGWAMPVVDGDMGGVNGDITAEGEPGMRPIAAAISIPAEVADRGDGTANPVDMCNGRSSSFV